MAEIAPLHALHYDQAVAGPLQDLWAPPYDVIDPNYRAQLAARSPHNAVRIDLPEGEDPYAEAARTLEAWEGERAGDPWAEVTDDDGNHHRLWRVGDPGLIQRVTDGVAPAELLIADGHHRYETARVYAQETGDEAAGWVLMCLVALEDPGLTVFPTHRLLTGLDGDRRAALDGVLARDFSAAPVEPADLEPHGDGPVRMGFLDAAG